MKTIAIIPARSGSKGIPDKNINDFNGKPLFASSIEFAKKLDYIDEVYFLTDSEKYAELARKFGATIPYLRGEESSGDGAMEEHVLEEFRKKISVESELSVLWLRPTHPLRDKECFDKAYSSFRNNSYSSVCIVTKAESRLYQDKNGMLVPLIFGLETRSMWRRQEVTETYKLYHGEFFHFPLEFNTRFLGPRIGFEVMTNDCAFDIDEPEDLDYLNYKIKTTKRYDKFLH